MSQAQSPFLKEAFARGYLHQCTDVEGLDKAFAAGPVTAYIGYDCTADSLHVGHLM
ncbi:MAG: tyrosine--tRNA ligase, partial [Alphaproteobacteria bacterium]